MRSKDIFQIAIACLAFLTIATVTCVTSQAQTANSKNTDPLLLKPLQEAAAPDDDDDKLDDSFRKFGSAAGAAYQCTPAADKDKLVREVMHAYSRIGQLFGTDRAFYFAVHFGNASGNYANRSS